MPKNVPSLKARELIKILRAGGCEFYREGKGDHKLYFRVVEGRKRVVPIDMGVGVTKRLTKRTKRTKRGQAKKLNINGDRQKN